MAELAEVLAGVAEKERREWERTAWMTAHMLNVSGKSLKTQVTADQLLGRRPERELVPPRDAVSEVQRRQRELD